MKISHYREDLQRYKNYGKLEWQEPSFWVVTIYRYGQWCMQVRSLWIRKFVLFTYYVPFAFLTVLTGINIPVTTKIGHGLRIWHFGCIVLHPNTVIGKNCDLRHGVTIGNRQEYDDVPVIGDNVDIGTGAKILGRIRVGDNVTIGANAVVIKNVPDNHIAVGVPAINIPKRKKDKCAE